MSRFLDALSAGPLLADGAMGSYIFELTGRLSEPNHVYESFSSDRPEVIRDVYLGYLRAGSQCLTTNTFAANRDCLAVDGMAERVVELNQAAVRVAREVAAEYRASEGGEEAFVLASVGPATRQLDDNDATRDAYREQLTAAASADAILLETFRDLTSLRHVLGILKDIEHPPVIAQMAIENGVEGWSTTPADLVKAALAGGAAVVGVNCCTPWDAEQFMEQAADLEAVRSSQIQLSAMPNAGGFQHIGNRYMTRVNPEFMGRWARTMTQRGARLVGGCCEIHPRHIWEMHNYLAGHSTHSAAVAVGGPAERQPVDASITRTNGEFSRKLAEAEFAVSVEILPARGTAPKLLQNKIDFVGKLAASGLADALDITDGSRGIPLMPPGDFVHVLRQRLGWRAGEDALEFIPHFTSRDVNTMGLQARLVGYWANGIHNVILVTGDPPKMAPSYPPSTAVFDLTSVDLIHLVHNGLNAGVDFGGHPLGKHSDPRTRFTIGTGFEPEALDPQAEIAKLERKIEAGADYILTQPAFRWEPLKALDSIRQQIPVLIGVLILTSLEHALRMRDVPGVVVPQQVLDRFGASEDRDTQAAIGRQMAAEQIAHIRADGWAGVYLMSPASHAPIIDVLAEGLEVRPAETAS
ncbi:MAG: hypothetical protein HN712_05745 [Gemmatimonadetes bacterium]|jgi:methionine synthase / methylenetetrahydrofolate reductase(NADPH)|nr:hypothetical protein [Gemmatimonadota bacterium]MBT6146305.1 hypothetical protein [Gemmatimonadota bacterium]MBT7859793.1 hypothetical protein [Gemmatimonadota bacterium]